MKGLFAARWGLALLFLLGVAWAMTPAGTVIRNQASAEVEGQRYLSNAVETVVQALCVPVVLPNGTPTGPAHSVVALAGGFAYLAYRLQNAGNAPFDFSLSWAQAGGDFAPSRVRFFLDVNGNARPNPGEPEISGLHLEMGGAAGVVMEVALPLTASGEIHLTPVLSCEGAQDADNYARITQASGPALQVEKSVHPARLPSGEVAEFSLVLRNAGGQVAAGPVFLTDLLEDGLDYVAGSARAPKGQIEYTGDGVTWQEDEPAQVKGLRLRLSKLEPGEEARLSFRVRGREVGVHINRAEATGQGGPAWAEAVLEVLSGYAHHLGPLGNPKALPGGEGSEDDRQTAPLLVVGQPYCFTHTLENAGEAGDEYTLEASGLPEGAVGWFETLEGSPLGSPLSLAAGSRRDFRYCLRAERPLPPFTVVLSAKSEATGSSNRTWDQVGSTRGWEALRLEKRVSPEGAVVVGDALTYTLRIENALADLEGVRVVDRLDPALEFLSASDGGRFDPAARQVVWDLGDLPLGTRALTLKVRVREGTPDNALIPNRFSLTSTLTPNPLESNTVQNRVFSAGLLLQKSVSPSQGVYGDRFTYRLEVANPNAVPLEVKLVDTPPAGTQYIPGSARLYEAASGCTGAHQPLEPTQEGGKLVWSGIQLGAGKGRCLTYALRVLPGASETLLNTAQAFGTTGAGAALASAQAKALARLVPGPFLDKWGTLVGRVFLDRDRDGRYTPGLDTPLPGARVILGNGLQTLTDAEGRYAFRDLVPGVWALTLDRASAPFRPLPHPEAHRDGYTHRVRVEGLTVSDFPLEALQGTARVLRSTVLEFGPLRVEKRLIPLGSPPERYRVVLRLEARKPLPDLTLTDPLPGGGEKIFKLGTFEGQRELFYEVEQGILTDPQVRWRYP